MLFTPPPATIELNVVAFASVTKEMLPAPTAEAEGNAPTVVGVRYVLKPKPTKLLEL